VSAYKKYEKEILEVIRTKEVRSFKDIFVYFNGCSRATAYANGLDKSDRIKEAIYHNKRTTVTSMLNQWIKSQNPTLQIAAMRILCDDEERKLLNQQYIDHTSGGDKLTDIKIHWPSHEG